MANPPATPGFETKRGKGGAKKTQESAWPKIGYGLAGLVSAVLGFKYGVQPLFKDSIAAAWGDGIQDAGEKTFLNHDTFTRAGAAVTGASMTAILWHRGFKGKIERKDDMISTYKLTRIGMAAGLLMLGIGGMIELAEDDPKAPDTAVTSSSGVEVTPVPNTVTVTLVE